MREKGCGVTENHMVVGPGYEEGCAEAEEVFPTPCAHKSCPNEAHPCSESGECSQHTLMGYEDELRKDMWDMGTQAEVAHWRGIVRGK